MTAIPVLSGAEIRAKFLQFFEARGHKILPSASLVPEDPTVLLTIAGMLPFKPIFLGQQEAEVPRATTSQKCVRTNDIENVGRTARHHTFFEMLGNFSFGDYFKKQAIAWGWELVTQVFQLPPERLIVSVFHTDEDAFAIWRDEIGIPAHRIQRMGEDNFWASGPTGPCGPCSEIYFDFKPEAGDATIDLEDDSRFLEIYNLVFMELNRDADGNLTKLKKQNIDTGLGLERMAQILQNVPNNYETDLIFPIVAKAAAIAGLDYHQVSEQTQTSLKVIGDHIRAVVHMIADGINASNVGRGYILRRLLRRVVRHGRLIGIDGMFTPTVAEVAIQLGEVVYPQVREREKHIKTELEMEERRFLQTLERGEKLLEEILTNHATQSSKQIAGVDAFILYDTYGFPLELTQEIAEEQGFTVDIDGFNSEMKQQQQRSQAAHEEIDLLVNLNWSELAQKIGKTEFVGYGALQTVATVTALVKDGAAVETARMGDQVQVILEQTPFYAESGGQVADQGTIWAENAKGGALQLRVDDVRKEADLLIHRCYVASGTIAVGQSVTAQISTSERRRTQAHHSATHLLQAALKKIVDPSVSQAGSLVNDERLRFDFNLNRGLSADEIATIEQQVNLWITEAHPAEVNTMPIAAAKAKGAVAMFGEKYGAEVRVVDFPQVSMELCGGTHVANTNEIGVFKIVSESGIAAGVRRIEAVCGQAVLDYLNLREAITKDLSDRFKVKPEEITERINLLQQELRQSQKEATELKHQLALLKADSLLSEAEAIGDFKILVAQLAGLEPEALKSAADKLTAKLGDHSAVLLGSFTDDGKVSLVASFGKSVVAKGLQAGKFVGIIAKICGGGGGGRPNFAQAGAKDASKLPEALEEAERLLQEQLQ
ncbi:MAG: alanine--tRNA ligase [Pseudanabaena sp. ELA607]